MLPAIVPVPSAGHSGSSAAEVQQLQSGKMKPRKRIITALTATLAAAAAPAAAQADTVTFSYTGGEQVFVVPAGVTSLEVTVLGARGASLGPTAGGRGDLVSGTLAVSPGQRLYVEVGGVGAVSGGGFNGGGAGGQDSGTDPRTKGGGGGGATDVRTLSRTNLASLASRRIVAAGGGGAAPGAAGGNAQAAGGGSAGGGAGTQSAGGAGSAATGAEAGTAGSGGKGGSFPGGYSGGGGGGGRYGGGGGGGAPGGDGTGGGGGGSSQVPSGGTRALAPATLPPGAQISFTRSGAGGGGGGGGAGGGGGGGGGGAADRIPPVLSRLLISPFSFSTANFGPSVARVGTRLRYRASEAATTTFTVQRARRGVRRGRRCVPRRRGALGRSCTRYVRVRGSFRHLAQAGLNRLLFSGRVGGRRLALGRYRLNAVAVDGGRNRSQVVRRAFRIVRR
jgi:Glycine rich protein